MMKKRHIKTLAAGISLAAAPAAFGQFDTAQDWNDGAQDATLPAGGPASFLTNGPGTQFEITAGGADFWGNSFICGPQGEYLSQADTNTTTLTTTLSRQRCEDVRRIWPFLRDRRIDAYQGLDKRFLT